MGPRWLRRVVLGTVTCLIAAVLVLVVVGAVRGTPQDKARAGAAGPSTTARHGAARVATSPAGSTEGAAKPKASRDVTAGPNAAPTRNAGGVSPTTGAEDSSAGTIGAGETIGVGGTSGGGGTIGAGGTSIASRGPASPGATTTPPASAPELAPARPGGSVTATPGRSQTTTAGSTLTYTATAPAGSSLVYLDPNQGEVQQANVANWTKSWTLTSGVQSEAAIVVTSVTTSAAVSCSISWHGVVVANQSRTGQADCQYVVPQPGA